MLTVTQSALERLSHRLARKQAADEMALRFTRRKGGWTLRLDLVRPDDTAFRHEGRNVLLLDVAVSRAMSNMMLDANDSKAGLRLRPCADRNRGE